MSERPGLSRVAIRVTGVVQGVGYRPFAYSAAITNGLTGLVGNDPAGVFVEAQGAPAGLEAFIAALHSGPPMSRVASVLVSDRPIVDEDDFRIVASVTDEGATSIPPDTAVCEDCLAELRDPSDRRHGYAFIACTNCGPRYTIVTGLPYDRPFTTMVDFPLCDLCQAEYDDPSSRRFHAQPTACSTCGPSLSMPIDEIVSALAVGSIVAIKGIGGYHLACDARQPEAVALLRQRKARGAKPFAVMARDVETAAALVDLDHTAVDVLSSGARPVVLAPAREAGVQESVAPGNSYVGVMLPYAPLHHLLFDAGAPSILVMTSGNVSDEPICTDEDEARERLSGLADVMVHHNRRIHVACDDSVVRAADGWVQPVRRSRGYAPLPIDLAITSPPLVAVGGELKTTVAVARGQHAWMSQHVGDTENLETLAMLDRTVATLTALQRIEPEAIVSDLHPAYLSRRWAMQEAQRRGITHLGVQHHHAHAASLLAEHRWPADEPVLAFAFDGTGYGADGTIWGGELLLGSYAAVERVGHLAPVPLPGGDAAIRRPLRTALAHAHAAGVQLDNDAGPVRSAEPNEVSIVERMLVTGAGCTPTTSMGRLFDAIASLLDVRQAVDYEGQAAIELEALAAGVDSASAGDWALRVTEDEEGLVLDPAPAVLAAVAALRAGTDRGAAALAFHRGVAEAVVSAATAIRARTGVRTVGLTGGVFANTVLTRECHGRLGSEGFTVLVHQQVPANDGGLALGQVAVAAAGGAIGFRQR
ncbi:MAG: carbamoyltransferase HypF [Actinomycetes bacterium]